LTRQSRKKQKKTEENRRKQTLAANFGGKLWRQNTAANTNGRFEQTPLEQELSPFIGKSQGRPKHDPLPGYIPLYCLLFTPPPLFTVLLLYFYSTL
jgi:hypothetical protein